MTWFQKENGQVMGITLRDLENYPGNDRPMRGLNGSLRFYCPIHGSDHQRSLKLNLYTGHFKCYSCGSWGYIDEINKRKHKPVSQYIRIKDKLQSKIPKIDVELKCLEFYEALKKQDSDGIAVRYLKWRGIDKETALYYTLGYAGWGKWPQYNVEGKLCRQWKRGRLTFPHTDPQVNIVNLYGRAIGADDVPPNTRHDHLNLPKAVFNCQGLRENQVILVEGAFDALSLLAAGYNAVAIFGVRGLNTRWIKSNEVIFAFDNDQTGQSAWKYLADQLVREGRKVYRVTKESYKGYKDMNELWRAEKRIKIEVTEYEPQELPQGVSW